MKRSRRGFVARLRRTLATVILTVLLLPGLVVVALRWVPPPTSSFMLQARIGGLGSAAPCARVARTWVDWPDIAGSAKLAVLAAEDQRFPEHWGFDFDAIGQALEEHWSGHGLRGASTISQQVAKNLFLWPGRSAVRKGLEAYLTLWIELAWPKRRILEVYLNTAQFGPCVFGVSAAARHYFDRPPARLSRPQAALLAAVLPNPYAYDPGKPSPYVRERAGWIAAQMRRLGGEGFLRAIEPTARR